MLDLTGECKMKPSFKHDCDTCKFVGKIFLAMPDWLGQFGIAKEKTADLYESCEIGGSKYILRCSSRGSDYITTNNFTEYML